MTLLIKVRFYFCSHKKPNSELKIESIREWEWELSFENLHLNGNCELQLFLNLGVNGELKWELPRFLDQLLISKKIDLSVSDDEDIP